VVAATITESEVLGALTDLLSELGVEPDMITGTAVLGRDLELDSTDAVEVGLGLKRRFEVSIKVQVKGDETVNDLVELVLKEAGTGK
jgi:acyl carrier protein